MTDFAKLDCALAKSQLAIGLSSNLAQIAQSYSYTFPDEKYQTYACILAVLAQVAIDNSKRRYDLDLNKSIDKIKKDMDVKTHGYPLFWGIIKKDFNKRNINRKIHCPMNYLADLKFKRVRQVGDTLPMETFFIKTPFDKDMVISQKVEKLISKYAFDIYDSVIINDEYISGHLILKSNFNELIKDIRETCLSDKYIGLMSWLIDRALRITPEMVTGKNKSALTRNKSLLLRTLYEVNPKSLLYCFSKNTIHVNTPV